MLRNFISFVCAGILVCSCQSAPQKLPIIGEREVVESVVDGKTVVDTIYPKIPSFQFLNQDSVLITDALFNNKIYVANFFFTHCPSICPTMQRNVLELYKNYKNDDRIAFLSHSIDFKYDSPSVLKKYATNLGVDNEQWQFVTGDKAAIYGISQNYLVFTSEDENAPGGYDHSGFLVLIDHDKHIRGTYDGTSKEQIQQLFEDVEILLQEYN